LDAAQDEAAVELVRVNALGKKGSVSELLKGMGGMSPEERQTFGPLVNGLKQSLSDAIAEKKEALAKTALDARLLAERIDVTLPARPERRGKIHPIMQVFEEVQTIFQRAICTTLSSLKRRKMTRACCCAPIPALCKCAPC